MTIKDIEDVIPSLFQQIGFDLTERKIGFDLKKRPINTTFLFSERKKDTWFIKVEIGFTEDMIEEK